MTRTGSYCRAYHARAFAAFSAWRPDLAQLRAPAAGEPRDGVKDDDVLYLQEDFTVTDGPFPGEHVVFADAGAEWRSFCAGELGFAPTATVEPEPVALAA